MMRWVVSRSLRFRWLVLFAATAAMAFGIAQIPSAKVDVFPEFAPPRVEIQTIALGNSSEEVEEFITVPMEEQLNGLPGLDELRSKSVSQLSSIQLIFERGTDELTARQAVAERVAQLTPSLPTWASPPFMMPSLSATSRIMKIGLTSDELNLMEMSADRLLEDPAAAPARARASRPWTSTASGSSSATSRSTRPSWPRTASRSSASWRPPRTRVDAGVLQYTESFAPGTGGFVESGGQRLNIRHVQPITGPRAAREGAGRRTAPATSCGWPTSASSSEDHQPVWGEGVVNGGGGPAADRPEVPRREHPRGHGGRRATPWTSSSPACPGIEIDTTIFRPATFIEQSIDNLTTALLLGVRS